MVRVFHHTSVKAVVLFVKKEFDGVVCLTGNRQKCHQKFSKPGMG